MSVRGTLCKFAATAVLAAVATIAVPTAAMADGGEAPQPSSASALSAGAASVGLFGPKLSWLEAFSRSNG
ncbi:hypothetical protein ACF9IK_02455 [Kitasatospora hibisci]|uniref:hypothetical protein n=1 Tax=Kitasatospora hibisci TaxID=3369522 RepID=UPI0037548D8D